MLAAADKGQLNTNAGVAEQVRRLLDSEKIQTPRVPRFFREYFGYESAADVFKTQKESPGHDSRALIADADRLVEAILEADKDVLRELLTTSKSYVAYRIAADSRKKRAEALAKYEADKAKNPAKFKNDKGPRLPGRSSPPSGTCWTSSPTT